MLHEELVDKTNNLVSLPRTESLNKIVEFAKKIGFDDTQLDLILEAVIAVATVDDVPEMEFAQFEECYSGLVTDEELFPAGEELPGGVMEDFRNCLFNVCQDYSNILTDVRSDKSFDNGFIALQFYSLKDHNVLLCYDGDLYAVADE